MSYIVSENGVFILAAELRRAPIGVRFIAVVTVVLLAPLLIVAVEGQGRAPPPSAQASGESPETDDGQIEARLVAKQSPKMWWTAITK